MDFSNHTFGSGLLAVNCFAKQGGILCYFVSLVNERTYFSKASPGTSSSEILDLSFERE
jgi:hypothetical protein